MLEGEQPAGAADAGLDLVQHQQPVVGVAYLAQARQVVVVRDLHAAFAGDRFHQHGDHVGIVGGNGAYRLEIVVGRAHETLYQWLEAGLHLAVAGGGEGGQGPAVKAAFHDHDGRALDVAGAAVQAGQLDGRLVGLGARVAEEGPVHAGQGGQARGQRLLLGDVIPVGDVDQRAGLFAHRLGHGGMGMTQAADGHAGQGVEVLAAFAVPQPGALAAHEGHGQGRVVAHQVFAHGRSLGKNKRQSHRADRRETGKFTARGGAGQ